MTHRREPHTIGPGRNLGTKNCAYDAGITGGPECPNDATIHVIGRHDDGYHFMLAACPEHAESALGYGYDWHPFEGVCGMPGTFWHQTTTTPGESFCVWPEADTILAYHLTRPVKENA